MIKIISIICIFLYIGNISAETRNEHYEIEFSGLEIEKQSLEQALVGISGVIHETIKVTNDWKIIKYKNPFLASMKYLQLELITCNEDIGFEDVAKFEPAYFKRIHDNKVIMPEVILSDGQNDYQTVLNLNGERMTNSGNCIFLGYRLTDEQQNKHLSKSYIGVTSIKLKSSTSVNLNHINWYFPTSTWSESDWLDVPDSQIVELDE